MHESPLVNTDQWGFVCGNSTSIWINQIIEIFVCVCVWMWNYEIQSTAITNAKPNWNLSSKLRLLLHIMFEVNARSDKHGNFQLIRFVSHTFLHVFLFFLVDSDIRITHSHSLSICLPIFFFVLLAFFLLLSSFYYPNISLQYHGKGKLGQIFSRDSSSFADGKCVFYSELIEWTHGNIMWN